MGAVGAGASQACGLETKGLVLWEEQRDAASIDGTMAGAVDAAAGAAAADDASLSIVDVGASEAASSGATDACGLDAGRGGFVVLGGQSMFSHLHGSLTTGTYYIDPCPSNQAVIGYQGYLTSPDSGLVGNNGYPAIVASSIQTICGALSRGGPAIDEIVVGAPTTLAPRGSAQSSPWRRLCPPNEVVIGFDGRSGRALDRVRFVCAHWTVPNSCDAPSIDVFTVLAPAGGLGGSAFQLDGCPAGQMAIGSVVRAGSWVDAFGLLCATPSLVFDGGT